MASQPPTLVLAAGRILDSKPLQVALSLILGALIGYQAPKLSLLFALVAGVALIVAVCCLRINWAICLLILLSPFHYLIKEISSSFLVDVWRELFLALILSVWLLQVLLGKRPAPRFNLLSVLVVGYVLWGMAEIVNSANLLVGIAGFRYMFSFVPLYFVAVSTATQEADIKRFVKAILGSGIIVAIIAIVQFILVSVLGLVAMGTSIDFVRKYAGAAEGYLAPGIPWQRASSILIGPNELGIFLAVCLTLMFSYYLSDGIRGWRRGLLVMAMAIMSVGLLASMSRSAGLALGLGCFTVGMIKRKGAKSLLVLIAGTVLLLVAIPSYLTARLESVYTLSDPYFTGTVAEGASSVRVWRAPFLGQGFGLTPSAAEKLGVEGGAFLDLGGVDMYALQSVAQVGLIGFSLFMLIWLLFLRSAYIGAKQPAASAFIRDTAAGSLGAFVAMGVASLHLDVWGYVSLAGTYYILGAVTGFRGPWAIGSGGGATNCQSQEAATGRP